VRVVLVALLVTILASCRCVCARQASDDAHREATHGGQEAPHPVNDDHCLCNGGLHPDLASVDFAYIQNQWSDLFVIPQILATYSHLVTLTAALDRVLIEPIWDSRADRARILTLVPSLRR